MRSGLLAASVVVAFLALGSAGAAVAQDMFVMEDLVVSGGAGPSAPQLTRAVAETIAAVGELGQLNTRKARSLAGDSLGLPALAALRVRYLVEGTIATRGPEARLELVLRDTGTGGVATAARTVSFAGDLDALREPLEQLAAGLLAPAGTAHAAAEDNAPPHPVFATQPPADEGGVIGGGTPFTVTFNMCRSRDDDAGDVLRYTYDFDGDGAVDFASGGGGCRASFTYEHVGVYPARVCVSDRVLADGHVLCRAYEVQVVGGKASGFGTFSRVLGAGDAQYARPAFGFPGVQYVCPAATIPMYYDLYTIDYQGGTLHVSLSGASGGGGTLADTVLVLYRGSFNPGSPCSNFVAGSDDIGGTPYSLDSEIREEFFPPGQYFIVAGGFGLSTGTYTLRISEF